MLSDADEMEILRNTIMTYCDVERVLVDSEIDGFKHIWDNSILTEIFFADGSSMIGGVYRDHWDMNLRQLEHYINVQRNRYISANH